MLDWPMSAMVDWQRSRQFCIRVHGVNGMWTTSHYSLITNLSECVLCIGLTSCNQITWDWSCKLGLKCKDWTHYNTRVCIVFVYLIVVPKSSIVLFLLVGLFFLYYSLQYYPYWKKKKVKRFGCCWYIWWSWSPSLTS